METEKFCWYCEEEFANRDDIISFNLSSSDKTFYAHRQCREKYIMANKISIDKKPINTLRVITNISLAIGIIFAITICCKTNNGVIFGILALFSSVLIWALLSVVCGMAENLIEIRRSLE